VGKLVPSVIIERTIWTRQTFHPKATTIIVDMHLSWSREELRYLPRLGCRIYNIQYTLNYKLGRGLGYSKTCLFLERTRTLTIPSSILVSHRLIVNPVSLSQLPYVISVWDLNLIWQAVPVPVTISLASTRKPDNTSTTAVSSSTSRTLGRAGYLRFQVVMYYRPGL